MRSDISYGNGMYKSVDAGKSWTRIGLTDTRQIGRILVDARDPNLVFVAALGHAYGPNKERGVFPSRTAARPSCRSRALLAGTTTIGSGSIRLTRAA